MWMHITKWKKPVWKGYIPHNFQLYDILENVKSMETIKGLVVARGWGGERWTGGVQIFRNYSVGYYNGGYMSLFICQKP